METEWLLIMAHSNHPYTYIRPDARAHTHTHSFWLLYLLISIVPNKMPISPNPVHISSGVIAWLEGEQSWLIAPRPQGAPASL